MDVEGWLYALSYATLFREFEHSQILLSCGVGSGEGVGWNQYSVGTKGQVNFCEVKSYTLISECTGVGRAGVVQWSTVFSFRNIGFNKNN